MNGFRFIKFMVICLIVNISHVHVMASPVSDLTGDLHVDLDDLTVMAEQWLSTAGCISFPENCADLDGSNRVDLLDFGFLANEWLASVPCPVVINEVHYNPDLAYELVEFIELYNTSDETVDISGWSFGGGISYVFPPNAEITAGGYIVVVEDSSVRTLNPITTVATKYNVDPSLIYGPFTGGLDNEGEKIVLYTSSGTKADQLDYQMGFPWPTVGDEVPVGANGNGHSIQLVNSNLDNDLAGSWRSGYPTPAAANALVYIANTPPHIRQVNHSPNQPSSADIVTVTAKVTDYDGVSSVVLSYQTVVPGSYIPIRFSNGAVNPAYEESSNWNEIIMHDDGLNGDMVGGDSVYSVLVPAETRIHRNLIRYRITVEDNKGNSITVPYADDTQPNFAYFVYDGVPAWTGAVQPGVTEPVVYDRDVMNSIPVYHLISSKSDVENATWYSRYTGSEYRWYGTMVYDGKVYDHIRYRARGGVWRYAMGKNMWKFDFNRGHYFQARDDYGKKYKQKWDKLNFSACIQQGDYGHRGEQGMFEAAGFKMFNLMGVEAPNTHWLQFRIIDNLEENGSNQYNGDLWGLYLAIEQMDGNYLKEHELSDGNLYKIEDYNADLNNQGATESINGSDYLTFKNSWYYSSPDPSESWWRQNVDLDRYYSYRCVVEGIHHGDIAYGKNYFFYHNPDDGDWTMYPWDLDLTWANNMYGDGQEPFINNSHGWIFGNQELLIEYNNRLREFHDLFYNTDQLYLMLDHLASIIDPPGELNSIVDMDRAMWDYNPVMSSSLVNTSKSSPGLFYQVSTTEDFEGMVQIMKNYVTGYRAFDTYLEDPSIPGTPEVSYVGAEGWPENDLRFETSNFSDPQGSSTYAGMKWRIAEVEPYAAAQVESITYLIEEESEWKYFKGESEPSSSISAWRMPSYVDSEWLSGSTPIGYGEDYINTELSDMRGNYTTVYFRKEFTVANPDSIENLTLNVLYDDGFNLWINGTYIASANVAGENLSYTRVAENASSPERFVEFNISNYSNVLVAGTNVIAVQILNANLNSSSDAFMDVKLTAEYEENTPPVSSMGKPTKPAKLEIDADWESSEIATFNSSIQIPADKVKIGRTYRVRCKMKDTSGRWSHWSDPVQFVAGSPIESDLRNYLRVSELMYNNGDAEYVELKNISSDTTLELSSVSIVDGVEFDFAGSNITSLAPNGIVLVVKNLAEFRNHYGNGIDSKIAGEFSSGSLSNSGETIVIEDAWNGTIVEFEYDDARGWPIAADGAGHSLIPQELAIEDEPLGTLDFGANWRASSYIGGSPGIDDPEVPDKTVMINEFMAHTDFYIAPHESNDWIELYNASDSAISLDGNWYLSDDIDELKKFPLPSSILAGDSFVSYDQVSNFNQDGTGPLGWGLNKAGDSIFLSYLPGGAEDRVVDCIEFKGQDNSVSLGRYPDGGGYWFGMPGSRGSVNTEPNHSVVISEIMYHPQEDTAAVKYDEYIELYNPTSSDIDMWTVTGPWAIDGGVSYTFPVSTTLNSGDRIVIVGFDPADSARLQEFEIAYATGNLTAGVDVFGPWDGDLSNNGERVTLEKPQDSDDLQDPLAISWIIVDECIYNDYWPWPTSPDGTGDSLNRLFYSAEISGRDYDNWQGAEPTLLH